MGMTATGDGRSADTRQTAHGGRHLPRRSPPSRRFTVPLGAMAMLLMTFVVLATVVTIDPPSRDVSYSEFRRLVRAGDVTAVLVGPWYGLLALGAGAVLIGLDGRPRLVGLLPVGVLLVTAASYNWVLLHEPARPPYDVPGRFEHLHRLALFAAVSLIALARAPDRDDRP